MIDSRFIFIYKKIDDMFCIIRNENRLLDFLYIAKKHVII